MTHFDLMRMISSWTNCITTAKRLLEISSKSKILPDDVMDKDHEILDWLETEAQKKDYIPHGDSIKSVSFASRFFRIMGRSMHLRSKRIIALALTSFTLWSVGINFLVWALRE